MSVIDSLLKGNDSYARLYHRSGLDKEPRLGLTVITCMDCRIQVEPLLGLAPGDANVLRNAGALVTEDVLRSLVLSQHVLGTRAVMVIAHTGCGLLGQDNATLNDIVVTTSGHELGTPMDFRPFTSLHMTVREQVAALRAHPWIFPETEVRGFVLDVESGALAEVPTDEVRKAA